MELGPQLSQSAPVEAVLTPPAVEVPSVLDDHLENTLEEAPQRPGQKVLRFNMGKAIRAAALAALSFGGAMAPDDASAQNIGYYDRAGNPVPVGQAQQFVPPATYDQWGRQQAGYGVQGGGLGVNINLQNPTGQQLAKAAAAAFFLKPLLNPTPKVVVVNQPVPVQVGAEAGRVPVQQERTERKMDLSQAQGLMAEKGIEVDKELNIVRGTSDTSPTLSINNAFNVVSSIDPSGKVRLSVSSVENGQKMLKVYILDTKIVEGSKDINGKPLTLLSYKELGSRPL